ncbi:hypothetical protein Pcinc_020338 [Petrolisthes cinctipes]|uniref:Uncharacterized protein n=1 Tax=Petrolisthes cinctipes TaxID=88211 RepID=A0AAE1FJC4_PETCI|nr:hypothetical protein Pcinc_020338 [Petrolisthes cinctipes]
MGAHAIIRFVRTRGALHCSRNLRDRDSRYVVTVLEDPEEGEEARQEEETQQEEEEEEPVALLTEEEEEKPPSYEAALVEPPPYDLTTTSHPHSLVVVRPWEAWEGGASHQIHLDNNKIFW